MTMAVYVPFPFLGSAGLWIISAVSLLLVWLAIRREYPQVDLRQHRGTVALVVLVVTVFLWRQTVLAQQPYNDCAICHTLVPYSVEWFFWQCFWPWCD